VSRAYTCPHLSLKTSGPAYREREGVPARGSFAELQYQFSNCETYGNLSFGEEPMLVAKLLGELLLLCCFVAFVVAVMIAAAILFG
jgi:hypothetical protein